MNPKCALNLRSQRVLRRNNQLQKKRIGVGISRCTLDKTRAADGALPPRCWVRGELTDSWMNSQQDITTMRDLEQIYTSRFRCATAIGRWERILRLRVAVVV